jgi:protein involved in polysaccharide export with SLBB domain
MRIKDIFIALIFTIGLALTNQAQPSSSEHKPIVLVYGNVIKKSNVPFSDSLTLTQAIKQSGGIEFNKKAVKVRIYRPISGSKEKTVIETDFNQIIKGKAENIRLNPYDLIYVVCPKGKKCAGAWNFDLICFGP